MWSYALKRGSATTITLAAASVVVFAFIHLVPGDPIYVLLGAFASWYRRFLMGMQARTRQRAEDRRKEQARAAKRARTAPVRR